MTEAIAIDQMRLPILSELAPAVLKRMLTQCRIVLFEDQEVILHKGAENTCLHFLLSGRALVELDLANRSDGIEIKAGQMFGEVSVIDETPVTAYVVAAATL